MRRLPTKDPTLIQVLSLYLLLLAFFVLLFNASQYDRGRASAVKESLSSTFRTHGDPANDVVARSSDQGERPGAELVLDSFADLIRTELKVAKVENLKKGRLLRVTLGADDLFVSGNAGLRDDRSELLSKLAQLLGKKPPGLRHKVEAYLVGGWIPPDRMTQAVPLPIARAATLAEALIARGALQGTVSGGVRHGAENQVALIYRVDPEIRPDTETPETAADKPGGKQ
jgi:flagellar motor protein MotB